MPDRFETQLDSPALPARDAFAIAPHDSNAITILPKAIYVGTGGTLVGRAVGASADVTFRNLQSGQILDVRLSHVRATGTSATDLVGLS
jgi:hypothetical protein